AASVALALLLCLVTLLHAVFAQHHLNYGLTTQQWIMSGLNHRIYQKSLRLKKRERTRIRSGDVINHFGSDTDAVSWLPWILVETLFSVVIVTIVYGLLFRLLKEAALVGPIILLLVVPFARKMGRTFTRIDDKIMKAKDQRISYLSQIFSGIRIVKYFTWENAVLARI